MATFYGPSWSLAVSFGILLSRSPCGPPDSSDARCVQAARSLAVGLAVVAAGFSRRRYGVNPYVYFAGYVILQYIVLATAWNILGGYAGYVNFGTPAFFALGAYTAVFLIQSMRAPLPVLILAGGLVVRAPRASGSAISPCGSGACSSPSPPWRCPSCSRP